MDDNNKNYEHRPVWGSTVRVWHWLLVISVTSGWLLGEFRSFTLMQYHFYAGYVTGSLLLIRIVLGFFGPQDMRFSALAVSPAALVAYAKNVFKRRPSGVAGHNPLGALSVIAMLILLSVQVITGLFSEDDALFFEGPLAGTIPDSLQLTFISIHNIVSEILLYLIGLHVTVILFYLIWKKENLVSAMLTGRKLVKRD